MGKLGAIVSQVSFLQLKDAGGKGAGIPLIICIFSGFMLAGLLFTFLLPETKGKTLEELSGEDYDENAGSLHNEVHEKNDGDKQAPPPSHLLTAF